MLQSQGLADSNRHKAATLLALVRNTQGNSFDNSNMQSPTQQNYYCSILLAAVAEEQLLMLVQRCGDHSIAAASAADLS